MSITIEQDLKELLERFDHKLDNLLKDVTDLKIGQTELKGEIKRVEGEIKRVEEKLDTKFDALNKRLDSQEFINRGVLVSLIVAILGGFAKLFGLVGNP